LKICNSSLKYGFIGIQALREVVFSGHFGGGVPNRGRAGLAPELVVEPILRYHVAQARQLGFELRSIHRVFLELT
jgi:hypothetical protein